MNYAAIACAVWSRQHSGQRGRKPRHSAQMTSNASPETSQRSTIGRWNGQGTMDEEYLFWDNATFMQQIGVGK